MPRARVSLLCSVRCRRRIGLWKNFEFLSDGRARSGLKIRITMKRR